MKGCSIICQIRLIGPLFQEANDLKDVKDAMNKIQKLRAQMKNPTRDGMIEALRDAKISALIEIFRP